MTFGVAMIILWIAVGFVTLSWISALAFMSWMRRRRAAGPPGKRSR